MAGTVQTGYVYLPFLGAGRPERFGEDSVQLSISPHSLEVTCSNCEEPDLREFKSGTHDLVLLDEATDLLGSVSALPLRTCTHTKCGRTKSKFIVGSNSWSAELAKCERADRAWLCAKSLWVRVSHPLYEV